MGLALLLVVAVTLPCAFVLGIVIGYGRGRNDAERDLAELTRRWR